MKKSFLISMLLMAAPVTMLAQLKVNSNGHVSVGSTTSDFKPELYVETSGSTAYDTNIGAAAQTVSQQGKKNRAMVRTILGSR